MFNNTFKQIPIYLQTYRYFSNIPNVSVILKTQNLGSKIELKGWVKSVRKQKGHTFIDLSDGSSHEKLQVLVSKKISIDGVSPGSSIKVTGTINQSSKGQLELCAENVEVYGRCIVTDGYPFAPRKHYLPEYIRQYLHLRTRTNKFASILRVRSEAVLTINNYLKSEGYINIHTPILTSNDCEGAGETFKVVPDNIELLKSMKKENMSLDEGFFDTKTFLSVSGQLHLEAAAHGLSKVYSFGPTFRAENSKTRFHLSEFYMLEAEVAFLEQLDNLISIIEKLIKYVTNYLLNKSENDIKICQSENKLDLSWVNKNFPVLTYDEAVGILINSKSAFKQEFNEKMGITKEQEIYLVNHCGGVPTFIVNWPKTIKPFYMKECENDDTKVAAFDLLAPGVGEIVGGSLRENDCDKLKNNLGAHNSNLDWYLDLRKFGGVPTGGYGLGFERYLMLILGLNNIKDVLPFPRWPHNCSL